MYHLHLLLLTSPNDWYTTVIISINVRTYWKLDLTIYVALTVGGLSWSSISATGITPTLKLPHQSTVTIQTKWAALASNPWCTIVLLSHPTQQLCHSGVVLCNPSIITVRRNMHLFDQCACVWTCPSPYFLYLKLTPLSFPSFPSYSLFFALSY